jgi:hypothetical protein
MTYPDDLSMEFLYSKVCMRRFMVFDNKCKDTNWSIEKLLPSMNRAVFCTQKCSYIILKLSLVGANRVLYTNDDLPFINGAITIC